jgi:hypothetical protein
VPPAVLDSRQFAALRGADVMVKRIAE